MASFPKNPITMYGVNVVLPDGKIDQTLVLHKDGGIINPSQLVQLRVSFHWKLEFMHNLLGDHIHATSLTNNQA